MHAEAVPADAHEAMRTEASHGALAGKNLAPAEPLVDGACVSGAHIVAARERHGVDLVGPARPNPSWQARDEGAFHAADFAVDWERRRVRGPEGRTGAGRGGHTDGASGQRSVRAGFRPADRRPCPSRPRRTRGQSRRLRLPPRAEHEAGAAAKARPGAEAGRRLHAQRRGVEGTIWQGVRGSGLRRARRRGLARTTLQSVVAAAAIDLDRLAARFARRPLARTRTSRFAAPAARPATSPTGPGQAPDLIATA